MSNFGKFAKYYDLVHQDKDYCTEASYIQKFINHLNPEAKTILDFGCGTGSYTLALHRMAFDVIGVDRSAEMIEIAKAKVYSGEDGPLFFCEKMENYQNQFKFDAIVCLFFSFCYQTTDELILQSLNCFASHLKKRWHSNF